MSRYSFSLSLGVVFLAVGGIFMHRKVDSSAYSAVRTFGKGGWSVGGVTVCKTKNFNHRISYVLGVVGRYRSE